MDDLRSAIKDSDAFLTRTCNTLLSCFSDGDLLRLSLDLGERCRAGTGLEYLHTLPIEDRNALFVFALDRMRQELILRTQ